MVRKLKNMKNMLDNLARQEKTKIIEDKFEDLEEFKDEYILLEEGYNPLDEEEREKYGFYVEHLRREDYKLPTYEKKELYDKKLTIRIGETEEKIIEYLKIYKGLNISELVRNYILSLGKEIADESFLEKYNKFVEEYNRTLEYIARCQKSRNKLKKLRGANEYTANILTKQRDLLKLKIKILKSKAKKLNYQLEKMEKILD